MFGLRAEDGEDDCQARDNCGLFFPCQPFGKMPMFARDFAKQTSVWQTSRVEETTHEENETVVVLVEERRGVVEGRSRRGGAGKSVDDGQGRGKQNGRQLNESWPEERI